MIPSRSHKAGSFRHRVPRLQGKKIGVSLSAGFFGFYAHAGFLQALEEDLGVVPSAIAGSSAGALVGALRATGLSPKEIADRLLSLRREDFWDPHPSWRLLRSLFRPTRDFRGYLAGAKLRQLLSTSLSEARIEELPIPLFVATTNATRRARHILRSGDLAEAVHASCAYPFLFEPVSIDGEVHLDGGLVDKAPMEELVDEASVEVLIVHLLRPPGRQRLRASASAWASFRAGVDAVRGELVDWKLRWARERGVEVYLFEPRLPPVSPRTMGRSGPLAVEQGRAETLRIANDEDVAVESTSFLKALRRR